MWDRVRSFAEFQVDDISYISLAYRCCHSFIESPQIGQAQSAHDEAVLTVLHYLLVSLYISSRRICSMVIPGIEVRL